MLKNPTEIIEDNPQIKGIWSVNDIGYLLRLKLVSGKKLPRTCLLDETEVLKIFSLCKPLKSA